LPPANPGEADAFRVLVEEEFTPLGGVIQLTFFKEGRRQGKAVDSGISPPRMPRLEIDDLIHGVDCFALAPFAAHRKDSGLQILVEGRFVLFNRLFPQKK
jgi:hypothetical protein